MKNYFKEDTDKKKLAIILLFVVIILSISIVLLRFKPYIKENSPGNTLNRISSINNRSSEFLNNSSIDIEKALKILPVMKEELIEVSTDINSQSYTSEKDTEALEIIQKGLSQNIMVLEQLEGLLNNPTGSDVNIACDNLKIYRDTTDSYYSIICSENSNFNLGTPMYSAINAAIDYCISSSNKNKLSEIKNQQNETFINEFSDLVISLNTLKTDFSGKINDYRNNKITYELLLSSINNCNDKITSVKSVMSSINIPDDFTSIFYDFSEIVNLYSDYLFNLKYNFITENVRRSKGDIDKDFLNSLYKSSDDILKTFNIKYTSFTNKYKDLELSR